MPNSNYPDNCPKCGSSNIAVILYGYPDFDAVQKDVNDGVIVLGGCVIDDDSPSQHCNECNHRWGSIFNRG